MMFPMDRHLLQNSKCPAVQPQGKSLAGAAVSALSPMFEPTAKVDECDFVLRQARDQLRDFIFLIGELRNQPLDMMHYQMDFPGAGSEEWVDLTDLEALVDSTIRKMKSNKKIKTNWSRQDVVILLWVVEKYNKFYGKTCENYTAEDWAEVGALVPGKNGDQAMFKWLSLKSNRFTQKRQWQAWQDACLTRLVHQNQQKRWFEISKELYLQKDNTTRRYRTAKQCRERWACYLNPSIKKGHWTPQEDYVLFNNYLEIGKKWSVITKQLEGRTQNAVKNRWKLMTDKYQRTYKKSEMTEREFFEEYLVQLKAQLETDKVKTLADVDDTLILPDFPALEPFDKIHTINSPRLPSFIDSQKQGPLSLTKPSINYQDLQDDFEGMLELRPDTPIPRWPNPKEQGHNYYEIDHDDAGFGFFLGNDKIRKSSFFE